MNEKRVSTFALLPDYKLLHSSVDTSALLVWKYDHEGGPQPLWCLFFCPHHFKLIKLDMHVTSLKGRRVKFALVISGQTF